MIKFPVRINNEEGDETPDTRKVPEGRDEAGTATESKTGETPEEFTADEKRDFKIMLARQLGQKIKDEQQTM